MDQHKLPLDRQYGPEGTGKGADVIDDGIQYSHHGFDGRVHRKGLIRREQIVMDMENIVQQ